MRPSLSELARARLKLLLELARVRLELLFRRSLRFLRRVKMTHAGARSWDPPVGKHTTPAPLDHAAGCQRPSPPRRDPLVQFRTFQVRTCRPLRDTLGVL